MNRLVLSALVLSAIFAQEITNKPQSNSTNKNNDDLVFLFSPNGLDCITRTSPSDVLDQIMNLRGMIRRTVNKKPSSCQNSAVLLLSNKSDFNQPRLRWACNDDATYPLSQNTSEIVLSPGVPLYLPTCGRGNYYMPLPDTSDTNISNVNTYVTWSANTISYEATQQLLLVQGTTTCYDGINGEMDILPIWSSCTLLKGIGEYTNAMYLQTISEKNQFYHKICHDALCHTGCVNHTIANRTAPPSGVNSTSTCGAEVIRIFGWASRTYSDVAFPPRSSPNSSPTTFNAIMTKDQIVVFSAIMILLLGIVVFCMNSMYRKVNTSTNLQNEFWILSTALTTPEERLHQLLSGLKASAALDDDSPTMAKNVLSEPQKKTVVP